MRAGKLRNLLTIEQNTPTRDDIGGTVPAWTTFNTWYCELVQVQGGEVLRGRTVHAQATYAATGRYIPGVTSKMRGNLDGRLFDILLVDSIANRGAEMVLSLKERNV